MWADFLSNDLLIYIALGFAAQLIDGALGMAYGLVATSVLLATGTSPAIASASVHAAEIVTTGLAGASHVWNKNVDWALFRRLAPAGVAGGIVGAYLLVGLPEGIVKMFVIVYLVTMTGLITRRILRKRQEKTTKAERERTVPAAAVGAGAGFLDAIGGGGWGPVTTSTLLARGDHPRQTIGSASLSEFFLTVAVSVAFLFNLDLSKYWTIVAGLIIGGAFAAPLAGILSRILPARVLMILVAAVVGALAIFNLVRLIAGSG
jgi:uncharacterized membrane protein YfcA